MAAWKAIGWMASTAVGAGLATIVVMCMMRPRTQSEWVVGIICTVLGSICGGAFVITHYGLQHWAESAFGLVAMLGLVFSCGLPAWALVRWVFNYIIRNNNADIAQVVSEARKIARGE